MGNIFMIKTTPNFKMGGIVLMILAFSALEAFAGGTGLPWDGPIDKISKGLSGPVAFLFAMGGMIVLGIRWVYGGEMGSLTQKLLSTVAGVSLLVFAIDFVAGLFGVSAALIAQ